MIVGKTLDFIFYRGVTFERSFVYKAAGVPVDLTGKKIVFHIRQKDATSDSVTINSDDPATVNGTKVQIISAVNGAFTVKVADEDITAWGFSLGTWWLALDDGADPKRIGGGAVSVQYP